MRLVNSRETHLGIELPQGSPNASEPEIMFRPFMFRVKLKVTGNSVQIVLYYRFLWFNRFKIDKIDFIRVKYLNG